MRKYYRLIGIVILVIVLLRIDVQEITAYFSKINFKFFLILNLLVLPTLFLKSYRWRLILRLQGIDYSIGDSFLSYLACFYAGLVTPGRIGEAAKALYLKKEKGIPMGIGLAGVFLDRLFDLYLLILIGSAGLWHFLGARNIYFGLVIFFALFIPIVLLFNRAILDKVGKIVYLTMISASGEKFFKGQFGEFLEAIRKIIGIQAYLPLIVTILAYLLYIWQTYLLAHLASINISYMTLIFFISITSLASMLPITFLGIGVREISLVYLFSIIGLSAESALIYSFLLFFSFYFITGIIGCIGWFIKGIDNRKKTACEQERSYQYEEINN